MINKQLRDKRAALLTDNRNLLETARKESRELTGDELTQLEKRNADVDNLTRQINAEERQAEQEARAGATEQREQRGQDGEFRSFGDFLHEVRFNRSAVEQRAMSMGTDGEGGFAVPDQFRAELLSFSPEEAVVRPRAMVIPAGNPPDGEIKMPALSQGANGVYGGVAVTWISEGATKPETSPAFLEVSLTPNEVAAHIVVTDKLLRNWQASGPLIGKLLRQAIAGSEDVKFLTGNGTGCPKGITDVACKIEVTRAGATAVAFADVANMLAKLHPSSLGAAVWVANISVLPQLIQMTAGSVSVNSTIFIQGDVTKKVPSTLLGIPIVFTGRNPVLGTAGDLMLCDFSYYLIKEGSGPFVAASEHVNFTTNKTVIKAFYNVDGDAWPAAPLKLEDGTTTVSPFVVLK